MQPFERNPTFTNPLANSTSPYLRQHAHNPVFWYPWGPEALERAREENKPILLSIGYSTCYWCHVMEREVFENLSIAALMNRSFINIKVDREEHPQLDEIYMVARQLLTREGGWPNNVFLTPDLKPFYAGGTFGPDDSGGKPGFPRILEWLNYSWVTQQSDVKEQADKVTLSMQPHLIFSAAERTGTIDTPTLAAKLFSELRGYYDTRSGGFFQAPKFPQECYLSFLLNYHEQTGSAYALEMVTHTLSKIASGGIYDHVGCGFHRYAVDKEWYVPHFEKMLYNQAMLARLYTDAARLTGSEYFADIAKSVLDFVSGPMADGNGTFYSGIDAETDGVEGAYYAWAPEDLQELLTPVEVNFFTAVYALADIPEFPGHKHVDGQVIIARKPLDQMADERKIPYVKMAAMAGTIMNKLLLERNRRKAPRLDDKVIVSWNGLMIDAYAHAGKVFSNPEYTARAKKAADFILEKLIDNDGNLNRIYAGTRAHLDATLEDYAYLIKGLISLQRTAPDEKLLEAIVSLINRVDEVFGDFNGGYFFTVPAERMLMRIKNGDDSALPNANAVMLHNFADLAELTKDNSYREKAAALATFFLDGNKRVLLEFSTMIGGALKLEDKKKLSAQTFTAAAAPEIPDEIVAVKPRFSSTAPKPGDTCELTITLDILKGWHINAAGVNNPLLIPTQVSVQSKDIEVLDIVYPEPKHKGLLLVYEGSIDIIVRVRFPKGKTREELRAMIRFQPCTESMCHAVKDVVVKV